MKKHIGKIAAVFAAFVLSLALTSCGNPSASNTSGANTGIGAVNSGSAGTVNFAGTYRGVMTISGYDYYIRITLNSNLTWSSLSYMDNTYTTTNSFGQITDGTYSKTNNTAILTTEQGPNGHTVTNAVLSSNGSTLVLSGDTSGTLTRE